jgi:lysophospholipase L1-like esterase
MTAVAPTYPEPRVGLVGNSLCYQALRFFPTGWILRTREGRALYESQTIIANLVANKNPEVMVIALGSNDTFKRRVDMRKNILRANTTCATVPLTVWVNVKERGVHGFYGPNWTTWARDWNGFLSLTGDPIFDWNSVAAEHPGWFLDDGLHMNATGQKCYANFIRNGVRREWNEVLASQAAA